MIALIKSGAIGRPPANRFADKTFFAPFDNRDPNSYIIRFAEFLKFLPRLVHSRNPSIDPASGNSRVKKARPDSLTID